jgi:hypothetical protein
MPLILAIGCLSLAGNGAGKLPFFWTIKAAVNEAIDPREVWPSSQADKPSLQNWVP